jgi:primosomal protein N'
MRRRGYNGRMTGLQECPGCSTLLTETHRPSSGSRESSDRIGRVTFDCPGCGAAWQMTHTGMRAVEKAARS